MDLHEIFTLMHLDLHAFYDNTLGFLTGAVVMQGRKTKIFYLHDWNFSYCNLGLGFHSIIFIHP